MMLGAGLAAWSSNFTIEVDGSKFTIKRDDTSTFERVLYRTVSQSALDGVHFTGKSGEVTFSVGDDSYSFTITETDATTLEQVYHYQTDSYRTYRFEVLDVRGQLLTSKSRTISYGNEYKVPTTYLNKSITDLIYFTDAGNWASGSGNKYKDIYNEASQVDYIPVTDAGYGNNGPSIISVDNIFDGNTGVKDHRLYGT